MFLLRLFGYANPYSFKELQENDIVSIENFVQKELEKKVLDKCKRLGTTLHENEKDYLFGIYADNVKEFKFVPGERTQILGAVESLREIFTETEKRDFIEHFAVPRNFKIDKNGTNFFSFGWFYGKKTLECVEHTNEMEQNFLVKLKAFFGSFDLETSQLVTEDTFKIVQLKSTVRADVVCIFCNKDSGDSANQRPHAVQYNKKSWNFSNLKKHVRLFHVVEEIGSSSVDSHGTTKSVNKKSKPMTSDSESDVVLNALKSSETPINLEDFGFYMDEGCFEKKTTTNALLAQFSAQNERLAETIQKTNETNQFMAINVDGRWMNINIVKIKADGNCLFSTLVHQLEYMQINTNEHKQRSMEIRQEVVRHMENNFDAFKHVLKLRLKCDDADIELHGKRFLTDFLSEDGYWGASESLIAATDIFKVNILVFNEKGPYYFSTRYNPTYDRTIFIAYRASNDEKTGIIYNHYDSVSGIGKDILLKCAIDLGEKIDTIIEIV